MSPSRVRPLVPATASRVRPLLPATASRVRPLLPATASRVRPLVPATASRTGLLLLAALLVGGCTFERRPDPHLRTDGGDTVVADPVEGQGQVEDSVRAVLASFREALRLGDVSRVAQLSTPVAVLVDTEENIRWSRAAAQASRLPTPLDGRSAGLGWELQDSTFELLGESALLVNRFGATVSSEGVPWSATETYLFVRTPQGWRIRHLHRSRGIDGSPP